MIDVLIGCILALIMFSIGLSLSTNHFRQLFARPRVLILGLFLQLILLPFWAWTTCWLLGVRPDFAVGFLVLAACPGGLTSNFISFLLRANTALSVSLTICNSTLSTLTVPLVVNAALIHFRTGEGIAQLPFLPTAGRIFLMVIVPVLTGMAYRGWRTASAVRLQPRFRWLSILLLGGLFSVKLLAPPGSGGSVLTLGEVTSILPPALIINIGALSFGRLIAGGLGFNRDDQLTLGVEAGIQNTSLAFLIASTFLVNEQMLKPGLVYAMFSFFTALGYGLWLKPEMWGRLREEWREIR